MNPTIADWTLYSYNGNQSKRKKTEFKPIKLSLKN